MVSEFQHSLLRQVLLLPQTSLRIHGAILRLTALGLQGLGFIGV